ncbi:hypothetical protein MYA_1167 [Burkholderia sp. KJ006]|nr:hypothetical protein MYA_1167 [Burkholderia sp. KJ006]CAG9192523.1 conserved hypothetical protein [Burkholderia vietnamiensis]
MARAQCWQAGRSGSTLKGDAAAQTGPQQRRPRAGDGCGTRRARSGAHAD